MGLSCGKVILMKTGSEECKKSNVTLTKLKIYFLENTIKGHEKACHRLAENIPVYISDKYLKLEYKSNSTQYKKSQRNFTKQD